MRHLGKNKCCLGCLSTLGGQQISRHRPYRMRLPEVLAPPLPCPSPRPLPPRLEAAWQRIRRAQVALERSLAGLTPDDDLVHQRNSRIYDLVGGRVGGWVALRRCNSILLRCRIHSWTGV